MGQKGSKPPGKHSVKRMNKGEGDIRARERAFRQQRMTVLRPHDEPQAEDTAGQPVDDSTPGDDHQKQMAEYRRRQEKGDDASEASTGEARQGERDSS